MEPSWVYFARPTFAALPCLAISLVNIVIREPAERRVARGWLNRDAQKALRASLRSGQLPRDPMLVPALRESIYTVEVTAPKQLRVQQVCLLAAAMVVVVIGFLYSPWFLTYAAMYVASIAFLRWHAKRYRRHTGELTRQLDAFERRQAWRERRIAGGTATTSDVNPRA